MARYIQKRLMTAVIVTLGVSFLVFMMVNLLPGDATSVMLAEFGASAEQQEELRRQLGLDRPIMERYWDFLVNALQGDLGRSLFTRRRVVAQILEQYPATFQLALAGMSVAIAFGSIFGVTAAVNRGKLLDTGTMFAALLAVSMPSFWLGLVFIFVFAVRLGWLPTSGTASWRHLVLPAFAIGLRSAGVLARLVRSSMLEVLRQDYITTARSKGVTERVVIWRHALKNALIPVVTVVGIQFGYLLGGTVITEIVFARQGIGNLIINAIFKHDFPLVQGGVLVLAVVFVFVNLMVDLTYGFLDPRVRYD
ncbi:MAG: ABC transporter permease [Clostridia bacterium]